jgi:hypothetical protein
MDTMQGTEDIVFLTVRIDPKNLSHTVNRADIEVGLGQHVVDGYYGCFFL